MKLKLYAFIVATLVVTQISPMQKPGASQDQNDDDSSQPKFSASSLYEAPSKTKPKISEREALAALAQLNDKQQHSIEKIEQDIDEIIVHLGEIGISGAQIGIAAATGELISQTIAEGGPIILNMGKITLLIANIIKHSRRLSKASPDVRAFAQTRILETFNSDRFIETVDSFEKFAANPKIPSLIRGRLQKLALKLKQLPEEIATSLVKK